MAISYPPVFVNDYLAEKGLSLFDSAINFFPSGPNTIEQVQNNGIDFFCVYDRMFRMRRKAFPHIKDEQLLYYFYSGGTNHQANLIETTQMVQDLLDRGDESGQEVNAWLQSKLNEDGLYVKGDKLFLPVYFHEFTIYQLEEARDIVDFGTARTYAGNKIIISYCYHTVGEGQNADGKRTYNGTAIS
jgi:hypothetical protein